MFTVEERAWRWVRRAGCLSEADREYAEGAFFYAAARLTVAMADVRRASFRNLPRWFVRAIKAAMP